MKNESSLISGYHGAYLSAVLLLFALIPLVATIQVTQNKSYASTSSTCQAVQIQYPSSATAGQKILIVTTVPTSCILSTSDYNEVIVNILLLNSSRILSTASATNGPARNTVISASYWWTLEAYCTGLVDELSHVRNISHVSDYDNYNGEWAISNFKSHVHNSILD